MGRYEHEGNERKETLERMEPGILVTSVRATVQLHCWGSDVGIKISPSTAFFSNFHYSIQSAKSQDRKSSLSSLSNLPTRLAGKARHLDLQLHQLGPNERK